MLGNLNERVEALDAKKDRLEADWEHDENPLVSFYVKIMPMVLNAERCSIFIYDPDNDITWLKAGTGLAERDIIIPSGNNTVVGEVISTGKHKLVTGLDKEEEGIHKDIADKTGFVTRDILCVPIRSLDNARVMGAVQILNKKDGGTFNDSDIAMLEEMAHYLELTIENIYFNQEVTSALRSAAQTMSRIMTTIFWIVGFVVVAMVSRVVWVGLTHST